MSHHYIQFTDVHYTYPSGYEALKGVTFHITHGEKVALIGLNGAGKSTLLLHTNGLLLPSEGTVNIGDVPVTKKTLEIIRREVGMVFQNPDDQLFMPTVEEDVAFGPKNMKLPENEINRRVTAALQAVGCGSLRNRPGFQLSGGQKRAIAISTILSMEPSVMIMDEPTSNLDIRARRHVINLLKNFDHTLLIATHDLALVRELCPRTLLMTDGIIAGDGSTEDILDNIELMRQAGLLE